MKAINEFLLSKKTAKAQNQNALNVFTELFSDIFDMTLSTECPEALEKAKEYFEKHDFDSFRVYWTSYAKMNSEKWKKWGDVAFTELLKADFADAVITDAVNNSDHVEDFYDYGMYSSDNYIEFENYDDIGFIIEKLDSDMDPDPKISKYWGNREEWIEFSEKPILAYIDGEMDDDMYDAFNQMCQDEIENCNNEFDIELTILGKGGKHVCSVPTFNVVHNYDKIVKYIEEAQDCIIKDMNDIIKENN